MGIRLLNYLNFTSKTNYVKYSIFMESLYCDYDPYTAFTYTCVLGYHLHGPRALKACNGAPQWFLPFMQAAFRCAWAGTGCVLLAVKRNIPCDWKLKSSCIQFLLILHFDNNAIIVHVLTCTCMYSRCELAVVGLCWTAVRCVYIVTVWWTGFSCYIWSRQLLGGVL